MYTIIETLLITKQVLLFGRKKFAAVTLNLENVIFVIYSMFFASSDPGIDVYPFFKRKMTVLLTKEVFTVVPIIYNDFADMLFM